MTPLIQFALVNAILATMLAIAAIIVGRLARRPALTHALWILVLLKFVTAPIIEVPVGLQFDVASLLEDTEISVLSSSTDGEPASRRPSSEWNVSPGHVFISQTNPEAAPDTRQSESLSNANGVDAQTTNESGKPQTSLAARDSGDTSNAGSSIDTAVALSGPPTETARVGSRWIWKPQLLVRACVWLWIVGTAVWFTGQGLRAYRFYRFLTSATLAPIDVQRQARHLANSMGLGRCPDVWTVDAAVSPMLWAIGSKAKLVFPAELLDRLDQDSRGTLLAHELAHYRRGDHWVRVLQFLVCGLYWWHPVVWWARREIEDAEEACCDAWVVAEFPTKSRRYAEALLDTIDFLSEAPRQLPSMASGLGHVDSIRKRLTMIMHGTAPKKLSNRGRLVVAVLAAVLLPLQPGANSKPGNSVEASLSTAETSVPVPVETQGIRSLDESVQSKASINDKSDAGPSGSSDVDKTVQEPPTARVAASEVWATATSPDGKTTITAQTDRSVQVHIPASDQPIDLTEFQITAIAFSPDSGMFASAGLDGKVRLWDCSYGHLLTTLDGHADEVRTIAFAPDGKTFVSGGSRGTVKLWNTETKQEIADLTDGSSSPVNCVRFSPDGSILVVAIGHWNSTEPGRITLWDTTSLTRQATLSCDGLPPGAIAFQADAKTLVSGDWKGNVIFWNLATGEQLATGQVKKDVISSAAFAPGGDALSRLDRDAFKAL